MVCHPLSTSLLLPRIFQTKTIQTLPNSPPPGSYVSAADAPYSQRALPPSNLDTNPQTPDYPYSYHVYEVRKPIEVEGGPIAPWFGQPGLGAQFWVGATGNILALLDLGYLARVNKSEVDLGPGRGNRCG